MASSLEFTGERMVPDAVDLDSQCYWEHIYRYRFASQYARGQRVLDVACGEGYGSAALSAAGAVSVVGVDISPDTVQHARKKYGIDGLLHEVGPDFTGADDRRKHVFGYARRVQHLRNLDAGQRREFGWLIQN